MDAIYYRNEELVTEQEKQLIESLFGNSERNIYNTFNRLFFDGSFETALHSSIEVLATIQNTQPLNSRDDQLRERILKGLTPAKGYESKSVEHNLLFKLIRDALVEFNKSVDATDKIEYYQLSHNDLCRIYGLPYKGIIDIALSEKAKCDNIPEPTVIYEYEEHWNNHNDPHSTYKHYYIKPTDKINTYSLRYKSGDVYTKLPFLGKMYFSTLFDEHHWQIYVNDYADRDWALQNVLHYMYNKI